MWSADLAPTHRRDEAGRLLVGGARADALAAAYGTPLLVMDVAAIGRAIDRFQSACEPLGMQVSYAGKAFICTEFARLIAKTGIGLDVCSLGELRIAEQAGYRTERLTMHGAGKTDAELHAAIAGRVGRVVLDGLSDLRRLAELAQGNDPVSVVLRVNTGIDIDSHSYVRTAGDEAKFGLVREEESAAIDAICAAPELRFTGLHSHVGSQISDYASLPANVAKLRKAAGRFAAHGLASRSLIAGGGFGVQADPRRPQDELDIAAAIAACANGSTVSGNGSAAATVEFEPGRAIVAHAGTTLYRVLAVKRRADRNLVIVDGGMADNPRPALYGAYHHVVPVMRETGPARLTSVFGRACESDFIADTSLPDGVARGDLLAACTTGAYTYSMSSNYNGFPLPAVVAVEDGAPALWVAAK